MITPEDVKKYQDALDLSEIIYREWCKEASSQGPPVKSWAYIAAIVALEQQKAKEAK